MNTLITFDVLSTVQKQPIEDFYKVLNVCRTRFSAFDYGIKPHTMYNWWGFEFSNTRVYSMLVLEGPRKMAFHWWVTSIMEARYADP